MEEWEIILLVLGVLTLLFGFLEKYLEFLLKREVKKHDEGRS